MSIYKGVEAKMAEIKKASDAKDKNDEFEAFVTRLRAAASASW